MNQENFGVCAYDIVDVIMLASRSFCVSSIPPPRRLCYRIPADVLVSFVFVSSHYFFVCYFERAFVSEANRRNNTFKTFKTLTFEGN